MNAKNLLFLFGGVLIGLMIYWVWSAHEQTRQVIENHNSRLCSLESDKLLSENTAKPSPFCFGRWITILSGATVIFKLCSAALQFFGINS